MKNLLLLTCGLFFYVHASAQSGPASPRIKLSDVEQYYREHFRPLQNKDEMQHPGISGGWDMVRLTPSEQEPDFLFERWKWYWSQHLDKNGYIVPAGKNYTELQKMRSTDRTQRKTGESSVWTFQGPDSAGAFVGSGQGAGIGRINYIAFHPTDTNIFWIASPVGGAWRTTNNGQTWQCMTDNLPSIGVTPIVINPLNPNTIYLGTGDRDWQQCSGFGVLKSYDGGNTWQLTGNLGGYAWADSDGIIANDLIMNPEDTNTLILATNAGIYITHNSGQSWTEKLLNPAYQLMYEPGDTSVVYAAISGGSYYINNSQVWRSQNGGSNWSQLTHFTDVMRLAMAVTPSSPNTLELIASSNYAGYGGFEGIYLSENMGTNFRKIDIGSCTNNLLTWNGLEGCTGQGSYTLPLVINPVNPNEVYTGGVNGWRSVDTGHTWIGLNQWDTMAHTSAISVHADKHMYAFNPLQPNKLYEVNDGGVYCAYDPATGGSWHNLTNGLGIGAYYRVAVSDIANFAMAGGQDIGVSLVRPGLYEIAGDTSDGMQCQLDPTDSTIGYFSFQLGSIFRNNPTDSFPAILTENISLNIDSGKVDSKGAWVTPFVIEPANHTCLLAGYTKLYKTCDMGSTWAAISDSLVPYNLLRIATTTQDSNTIYVAGQYMRSIQYTHNSGASWHTLSVGIPAGDYQYIADIKIDPIDTGHIWVAMTGYGGYHVSEWRAATGWQWLYSGLPDVPVHCIAQDYTTGDLYVGTDIGVFYRDTTMAAWQPFGTGLPAVAVNDLQLNYNTQYIWAATYGRGLWNAPKAHNDAGVSVVPFVQDAMKVVPNPNNGKFQILFDGWQGHDVNVKLMDINGRIILEKQFAASNKVIPEIDATGIRAGNYLLEAEINNYIVGRQKVTIY